MNINHERQQSKDRSMKAGDSKSAVLNGEEIDRNEMNENETVERSSDGKEAAGIEFKDDANNSASSNSSSKRKHEEESSNIHETFEELYGENSAAKQEVQNGRFLENLRKTYRFQNPSRKVNKSQQWKSSTDQSAEDKAAYSPLRSYQVKARKTPVGLGYGAKKASQEMKFSLKEKGIRIKANQSKILRMIKSNVAAVLVFFFYLVNLESMLSCALTIGLTLFWYFRAVALTGGHANGSGLEWSGSGLDWIVLGFAVVTPITVSIGMAFRRRELALFHISRIRSFSFQFYLAHAVWNWDGGQGRDKATTTTTVNNNAAYYNTTKQTSSNNNHNKSNNTNHPLFKQNKMNWLEHTDQVLEHLIRMCDELCRFLTLPTSSRTYHRMLKSGREEAAEIVEVQYRLFDSLYTKRITKLTQLTEVLKTHGLSATEGSRLRQYERYIGESIEGLRMIKMYRTPQALRSFGRLFTLILPPLYAASFSSLAIEMQSLTMGILFALITPLCLTALFESMTNLEDPFVGWTTLDGIDVAEELEVLHWHQLNNARLELFPDASQFSLEPKDDELSHMSWRERDGDMFDLKLLESMNKMNSFRSDSRSSRFSRYALDASNSKVGSRYDDIVGMDGSGRISHYALDVSGSKRINSNYSLFSKHCRTSSTGQGRQQSLE